MPHIIYQDGKAVEVSVGFRVQRRGRYNKWENAGLYSDRDGAQFFIDRIGLRAHPNATYRIVEEKC